MEDIRIGQHGQSVLYLAMEEFNTERELAQTLLLIMVVKIALDLDLPLKADNVGRAHVL